MSGIFHCGISLAFASRDVRPRSVIRSAAAGRASEVDYVQTSGDTANGDAIARLVFRCERCAARDDDCVSLFSFSSLRAFLAHFFPRKSSRRRRFRAANSWSDVCFRTSPRRSLHFFPYSLLPSAPPKNLFFSPLFFRVSFLQHCFTFT